MNKSPVAFAHWHGDELVFLSVIGHYRVATITSTSIDGDLMDRVARLMGAMTVRGSSTRGAVGALKGLVRLLKSKGRNTSFAVDGPKGPLHKVKPGVFEISRLLQCPIYPGGIYCDRAWHFPKSWNKTYLPKPFAKIEIYWGEAIGPVLSSQDPRANDLSLLLEEALHYSRDAALKKTFAQ